MASAVVEMYKLIRVGRCKVGTLRKIEKGTTTIYSLVILLC